MNRTLVKIIAIVLALVMAGGVCIAAVQVFAAAPAVPAVPLAIVATGENNFRNIVIVVAAVAAVGVIGGVLAPKFKK